MAHLLRIPLHALTMSLGLMAGDLAPTGTLRAVYLGDNPVQARKDPKTGAVTGVAADLTQELARQLGVRYMLTPQPDARTIIASLVNHTADVGFLAWEAQRASEVDFAGGYLLMYNSFVVPAHSSFQVSADVDRPGARVGGVRGQSQQIFLSANLKNASVRVFETMPTAPDLERLMSAGELNAFGLNRQRSLDLQAATNGRLRALDDSFLEVEQCFVVAKGDPAKLDALRRFVAGLRASGFL